MTRSNAPAYMTGFGNHFATEAVPGALPEGRNSPQRAPMGLYAEQLSGTAFTAPRRASRAANGSPGGQISLGRQVAGIAGAS